MKKLSLIMMLAVVVNVSFAQSSVVATAFNYLKMGVPDKARVEIDKAIEHESTKNDVKTWFYRGNIYIQLYTYAHMTDGLVEGMSREEVQQRFGEPASRRNYKKVEDGERWNYPTDLEIIFSKGKLHSYEFPGEENYKAQDDGTLLDEAYKSYMMTIKLDPKYLRRDLNPPTAGIGLSKIVTFYYNAGVMQSQNENAAEALKNFEAAGKINDELGKTDNNLILYSGYSAETLKDTTKAIKYYSRLADNKIDNPNMYMSLAYLHIGLGDFESALKAVEQGRAVSPDNQNLLLAEANIYLKSGEAQKAQEVLRVAAERDPDNAQLQFAIGSNYDKVLEDTNATEMAKATAFESAKQAYKKALEIDSNYFDAAFNLGAMLNNKAAVYVTSANNLPLSETEKYNELMNNAKALLLEAKPYLEKCHELDSTDRNVMIMLREIYSRTQDFENLKIINAKIKGE